MIGEADLAPLRAIYAILCADTTAAQLDDKGWGGWFERIAPAVDESGAIHLPYVNYGPKMDALWRAFGAAGWREEPFDWMAWLSARPEVETLNRSAIGQLGIGDLSKLLLAIERRERFQTGHWASCVERLVFTKIAMCWLTLTQYPAGDADFTMLQ